TEAGKAASAALSAGANADAAAAAATQASGYADAAGIASGEARAAAGQARRHAAEATRAANAASALAQRSAAAAYRARDAANKAADHAERAAAAAKEAAEHAVEADKAADQAEAHAKAAKTAADTATDAVKQARTAHELAQQAEAEDLAGRTAESIEKAKDLKEEDDRRTAEEATAAEEFKALNNEADALAAEAAKPGAPVEEVVAKGRKVALRALKTRGPWSQTAAQTVLAGSDRAVVEYVRSGWREAVQQDDYARVARLADDGLSGGVRQGAEEALAGDAGTISAFLNTGQYQAAVSDYRVQVLRINSTGGTQVKEAAKAALNDGSPAKLVEFLDKGQYTARNADERVTALQLISSGGPEVKAAAKIALSGPPRLLHAFLESGQSMAQRKDHLAATHQAQIERLIAGAAAVAATAQQNAHLAGEQAARARKAADKAEEYKKQAQASAAEAKKYADQARKSAESAEASARQAAESAKQARAAEADARRAAREAQASASLAANSADHARGSAEAAWASANQARASAEAAGKDSEAARQAGKEAFAVYVAKKRKEDEEKRRAAEARKVKEQVEKAVRDAAQEEDEEEEEEPDFWGLVSGTGHFALDVAGLFPGAGELADLANCAWYGAEGDAVEAGLSCASAVPGAGYGASAVKFGKWGKKGLRKGEEFIDALKGRVGKGAKACAPNSFTPETPVVTGDGATKPIGRVQAGDRVLATDPVSGRTLARTVDRVIVGEGTKNLVRITVESGTGHGRSAGTLTATAGHPFWAQDRHDWVDAGELRPGSLLRTPSGTLAKVTAVRAWTAHQRVFNLSVSDLHTYYAVAGGVPVLVHNSGCVNWSHKSTKTFGHTFKDHGKSVQQLADRARKKGEPQGRWINNDAAAEFMKGAWLADAGPRGVRIPDGLGEVVFEDGTTKVAKWAVLVPSKNGLYKTAYPILSS
ncbi:polymorphic toxin-type HINT domain-containing protein, partial [Streptomyces chrestomyceticus]